MSQFNYDGFSEGDWDEREEFAWSEKDWQQYLQSHHSEVNRFQRIYNTLKEEPGHIDEVAHLMGWDREDWSLTGEEDDDDDATDANADARQEGPEEEDLDPYTLHRHPVYIFTHGLYQNLRQGFEQLMQEAPHLLDAASAWNFANSLHRGEMNAIMALQSQDLGDFALTVCHLKNALSALNQSLATLQAMPARRSLTVDIFRRDATIRLFDLREVWLRVMGDCRDEIARRQSGREDDR